jgi:phosphoglucomutase/phosphomannomutase
MMKTESSRTEAVREALKRGLLTPFAAENLLEWLSKDDYSEFHERLKELIDGGQWHRLNDCFFKIIPFGTGGRRGTVDVGTNKINFRTIGESAQGLAACLKKTHRGKVKVVIAYDVRHFSKEFARRCAEVLAANGIHAYIFEDFRSTPELSFAVRHLKAHAGIVISASHNPPSDNGFKAYWSDGGQVVPPHDADIIEEVKSVKEIPVMPFDDGVAKGMITLIGKDIDERYLAAVKAQSFGIDGPLHVVFTPLNGTGLTNLKPLLETTGFTTDLMPDQSYGDPDFTNVANHTPNPEIPQALEKAVIRAKARGADLVLATDPDADRLGVAVPKTRGGSEWVALTGNEIGSLLVDFILARMHERRLRIGNLVVKTLVTTDLISAICRKYGVRIKGDLFVGFKYVAQVIHGLKNEKEFIFGAEESHGFLKGAYARDKDASVAGLLMAELAALLKKEGKTPFERLQDLYVEHGYYSHLLYNWIVEGAEGMQQIGRLIENLWESPPVEVAGIPIREVRDYMRKAVKVRASKEAPRTLRHKGKDNMLNFVISERERFVVRPSGTEPKMKIYIACWEPVPKSEGMASLEEVKRRADGRARAILEGLRGLIGARLR